MRNLILSALILASAFQTALGQIVEGQWTYIVENGGATITASTATGAVTIPSELGGYAVKKVGNTWPPIFGYPSTSVTSVTIPSSVTSIGASAFRSCTALTSITIPDSVTSMGYDAFYDCTSLTSVLIGSGVTSIPSYAFYGCTALTTLTIPNSVTSIGGSAFYGCTSLINITIPNSITSIGPDAFYGCTRLGTVILPIRFANTYASFGLTASQVSFDGETTEDAYLRGQQSVINNPSAYNLYTATQYTSNFNAGKDSILNSPNSNGLYTATEYTANYNAGKDSILNSPNSNGLYTATEYTANFNAGKDSILNSPNSNGLYTTSQIQYMTVGSLFLTRQASGDFVLNCDLEQSTDLQNWTTYQSFAFPLTGFPSDKAFVRFKAKE